MDSGKKHKWEFAPRFRKGSFGWRSEPAITRIKEAVSEIGKIARRDPILGAEGAVLFLEKVSPALEQVDSSSGAIGTAVNNAIEKLTAVIAKAPASEEERLRWLDRLWGAVEEDRMPYIEHLTDQWGDLCATTPIASKWADELVDVVRMAEQRGDFFKGTTACLSSLFKAGRNAEILELVAMMRFKMWHYRKWGVKALCAMGKKDAALEYAEDADLNDSPYAIAMACEEILISEGKKDEAYRRYARMANSKTTNLATFRSIVQKYPERDPRNILRDLAESAPGEAGKWFAAAKSAGFFVEAIELANSSPCDPKTLTRAARDMAESEPKFAIEAGIAALKWLVAGYGYEITGADVHGAYLYAMKAAEAVGKKQETFERIRTLVAEDAKSFVAQVLGPTFGIGKRR